jgi:hypothetical protein
MKTPLFAFLLLLTGISALHGQSDDRFIRIVGNASKTFTAFRYKADFTVSELKENEQRKIKAASIHEVYARLIDSLAARGIPEESITYLEGLPGNATGVKQNKYSLALFDFNKIPALHQISLDGFRLQSGLYSFSPVTKEEQQELAKQAIADAQRKAEALAVTIGKTVGKILNIEDNSTGCCGDIKDDNEQTASVTYHINITFRLK